MYLSRPPLRQTSRLFRPSIRNGPLSRSFQTSRPAHVAPAPATRRKNSPGTPKSVLRQSSFELQREYLKLQGTNVWTQARVDRILERTLPKERFLDVAERLFQAAEESKFQANPAAIQDIGLGESSTIAPHQHRKRQQKRKEDN